MIARGIRNCNPGNLERGTNWLGLKPIQDDPRFCQFVSMDYGCRALLKTLMTYRNKHGLKTIRGIINRWAPNIENNTSGYMQRVSKAIGYGLDDELPMSTKAYVALGKAIAGVECGAEASVITEQDWDRGAGMAGL